MSNNNVQVAAKPGNREFYSQLEGLRGIAVFLVMISHFIIVPNFPQALFLKFGFWGVNLFFVLSGFLITEILLLEINNQYSTKQILKKFYTRRTLRIFPIYYLSIVLLFLFDIGNIREVALYTLTYTYNLANFYSGITSEELTHVWSLCVEEQFYLLWPALLIIVNRKWRFALIVTMIAIGIFSRVIYIGFQMPNHDNYIWTTPACFDCLGIGALLAWMKLNKAAVLQKVLKGYFIPILLVGVFFFIAKKAGRAIDTSDTFNIIGRLLTAIVGFYVIGYGAMHKPTLFGKLLNNRMLRFTGKISYGLYVYHWILYSLLYEHLAEWLRGIFDSVPALAVFRYNIYLPVFVIIVSLTIVVAYVSFRLIELPIMRLRGYFEKPDKSKPMKAEQPAMNEPG